MPSFVLYPLAVLGLITAGAFAALAVLVLIDNRRNKESRRTHRRPRESAENGSVH